MDRAKLKVRIEALAADRSKLRKRAGKAVDEVIELLDRGEVRVCEPAGDGWQTNAWIKTAILLYFGRYDARPISLRDAWVTRGSRTFAPSYFDKVPTKRVHAQDGVRIVPPGVARYGSYLARNVILMPGYVNIGAYVDEGTMVDTWATVGSCAQIGRNVHLSGGVGIGGVLEPPQAQPVIVEDGAFIGSRCVVVEGVHVGREAVLGAGVVLTGGTPIVDVRGAEPVVSRGFVPPRAVVIPGTLPKEFAAGTYQTPCALLIGERTASTDRKTSLESAIREFALQV